MRMSMGKVYSSLMRPLRIFNVANRAEKIISREKPIPAPHYTSTTKQKILADQVNPSFLENHYRRNTQLDQRLKDVFVTSSENEQQTVIKDTKQLPQDKITNSEFEFYEPDMIPAGKCSLRQVFTFLSQYKKDPAIYNSENIAAEYKMDKKIVDDILKHFKLYVSSVPVTSNVSEDRDPTPEQLKIGEEFKKIIKEMNKKDKE